MTTSLVPTNSFEWSSDNSSAGFIAQDVITLDPRVMANISAAAGGTGNVTISNTTGTNYYYNTTPSMTISSSGNLGIGTVTIGGGVSGSSFKWKNEEFVDSLPDFDRIQKMCELYPGFKIAFEKFKTTYYLIKDDYDTSEDQRPIP